MTTLLKPFLFFVVLICLMLASSNIQVSQAQVGLSAASEAVMDTTFIMRPVTGGKYGQFRHYTIDFPGAGPLKNGTHTISIAVDGFSKAAFTVYHPTYGLGVAGPKSAALPLVFGTVSIWRKNVNALIYAGTVLKHAGYGYIGAVTVAGASWSVHLSTIYSASDNPSGAANKIFTNTFKNAYINPSTDSVVGATRNLSLNFGYGQGWVDLNGAKWMRIWSSGRCRMDVTLD